jgi:hypothetical protein
MNILDLFAGLLILLAVLNVGSTVILVLAALRHRWPALEERATVAVILAIGATVAATLGMARLHVLSMAPDLAVGLLVVTLTLISLPSLIWLVAYLAGRFEE